MALDTRPWNLVFPLVLAAGGCSPASGDGGEAGGEQGETAVAEDGEDSESTAGDESGSPECTVNSDCGADQYCLGGVCMMDPCSYFDGRGCKECSSDEECGFGNVCSGLGCYADYFDSCAEQVETSRIPLGDIPAGILHFAQVDGDAADDLLVVQSDVVNRVNAASDVEQFPREAGAGEPAFVRAFDVDSDGVEELLVVDDAGSARVVVWGGAETEVASGVLEAYVGNFLGDGALELVVQLSSSPTLIEIYSLSVDGVSLLETLEDPRQSTLLPMGAADEDGFQNIRLATFGEGAADFLQYYGEPDPQLFAFSSRLDSSSGELYSGGTGPLPDDESLVVVGALGQVSRVAAPTFGTQATLPPIATLSGAYVAAAPIVVKHGERSSVFVLGDDMRQLTFEEDRFGCEAEVSDTAGVQQMVAGDFDGDGAEEIVIGRDGALELIELE